MNDAACAKFEPAFMDFVDEVALSAAGYVKERLLIMVRDWPALAAIVIFGERFEKFDEVSMPVARACAAAGFGTRVFSLAEVANRKPYP